MTFVKSFTMMILGTLCSSCSFVSGVNMKEANIHYEAANNFEAQGDFVSAREQYWKALVAARLGGAEPATISMLTYEFGRTTGYACHLEESETFLLESLEMEGGLSERNPRNIGIRLFELARLTYDQKRYDDAAKYYSRGLSEVEKIKGAQSDPIAFANIYEEYADALKQSGNIAPAEEALRSATNLREAYPDRTATFIPVRYKCDVPLTTQSTGPR
jgi:tetratricopeptide (TPR) repeat protein